MAIFSFISEEDALSWLKQHSVQGNRVVHTSFVVRRTLPPDLGYGWCFAGPSLGVVIVYRTVGRRICMAHYHGHMWANTWARAEDLEILAWAGMDNDGLGTEAPD